MSQGAKPTIRVARILGEAEIIPMPTPGNNPLKAIPKKDRKKIEKDNKDSKEDTKKEAAPKVEEKKDQKTVEKKEVTPKLEEKKDKK
jgi:small subunit ribosomal protein S16